MMMNTLRLVSRQNLHRQLRHFHKCVVRRTTESSAAAPSTSPLSMSDVKSVSPKIDRIANDISALNLIEVAELSELLKKRLNLPDVSAMPMGGFAVAGQAAEEEDVQSKIVQTAFTVKITEFNDKQKVALIKEIKNQIPDTNLVQAKKFIENLPVVVKADISKDEAEKLKELLVKAGATVEIV